MQNTQSKIMHKIVRKKTNTFSMFVFVCITVFEISKEKTSKKKNLSENCLHSFHSISFMFHMFADRNKKEEEDEFQKICFVILALYAFAYTTIHRKFVNGMKLLKKGKKYEKKLKTDCKCIVCLCVLMPATSFDLVFFSIHRKHDVMSNVWDWKWNGNGRKTTKNERKKLKKKKKRTESKKLPYIIIIIIMVI